MIQDPAPSVQSDEWPQEPDGFSNLRFGSTKEEVEESQTLEQYGLFDDGIGSDDLPFPTRGTIHFSFAATPITAFLTFTPADGLHCIQGSFPSSDFERLKSAFIDLYGQPHEASSQVPVLHESLLERVPKEKRDLYNVPVESLLWFSSRRFISLTSHQIGQSIGALFLATASYMRNRGGWEKMVAKAKQKLAVSQEVYEPPDGWSQEPDGFGDLQFGMTKAKVETLVELGKRTELEYSNVLYDLSLKLGETEIAGTLTFNSGRLITVSGKFDRSRWDSVKSAFITLYGRPHCLKREEIFEQGMAEILDWSGDRRWIRLIDFPDGTSPGFSFQRSLKGAIVRTSMTVTQTSIGVGVNQFLAPEPPRIGIVHTGSKLALLLPDGSTLDYPRVHHPSISLNCSWRQKADGLFLYDLEVDTTDLSSIGIGEQDNGVISGDLLSQPDGWCCLAYDRSWLAIGASRNEITRFSIESQQLPGPVPLYVSRVSRKDDPGTSVWSIPLTLPRKIHRAVGEALGEQAAFLNDRFVIGPAIPRVTRESDLRLLARRWVDRYGFNFLEPILDEAIPFSAGVEQLQPTTPFEEQIVDCLRRALRSEPAADS